MNLSDFLLSAPHPRVVGYQGSGRLLLLNPVRSPTQEVEREAWVGVLSNADYDALSMPDRLAALGCLMQASAVDAE